MINMYKHKLNLSWLLKTHFIGVIFHVGVRVISLKFTSRHSKESSVTEKKYLSKSKRNEILETRECWKIITELDSVMDRSEYVVERI